MASTDELLETLRGEIFAAEVKVILDKELGRETSEIVKRLAAVKLPPRARPRKPPVRALEQESVHQTRKEQLLETLRGEIFAAEMKVILDKELGRETSEIVKRLAAVKLPPRARPRKPPAKAPEQESVHQTRKEQLLETLRREIFAAEMKVILDKELGRETSSIVKRLAAVKLPPARSFNHS